MVTRQSDECQHLNNTQKQARSVACVMEEKLCACSLDDEERTGEAGRHHKERNLCEAGRCHKKNLSGCSLRGMGRCVGCLGYYRIFGILTILTIYTPNSSSRLPQTLSHLEELHLGG